MQIARQRFGDLLFVAMGENILALRRPSGVRMFLYTVFVLSVESTYSKSGISELLEIKEISRARLLRLLEKESGRNE